MHTWGRHSFCQKKLARAIPCRKKIYPPLQISSKAIVQFQFGMAELFNLMCKIEHPSEEDSASRDTFGCKA
ncbi:hypothetical protein RvY_08427 [Ramazzottius varieornatus]|uniref:Uncharacterized protein n=1 Tax=Ramazzottius varieornatus TaxID=947166 RepID=A0A1D1VEY7_RAMVA|nr:hypothetical protein RvY_08427 [Ramazzottius varieornatus]